MYLFTRSARLGPGRQRDAMAWAMEITEKVNQISELRVQLWRTALSPGLGRLTWSTVTDDLPTLESLEDKLIADEGYMSLVERGAEFSSGDPIDDQLVRLIHAPADAGQRDIQYASIVTASAANGQFARAVEVGVQIAQAAERVTGVPTTFGLAATGPYGQVGWIVGYADLAQMQQAEAAFNADPDVLELLDGPAAQAYLPGSGTQSIARLVM